MLLAMVQNHSTEARLARSPPRSVRAATAGAQKQVGDTIRRRGANVVLVDGEFITVGTGQSATDR